MSIRFAIAVIAVIAALFSSFTAAEIQYPVQVELADSDQLIHK